MSRHDPFQPGQLRLGGQRLEVRHAGGPEEAATLGVRRLKAAG